jgi:addiction module HigA family antidote
VHPGEVLTEEFLRPLGLSASALARRVGVAREPGQRDRGGAAGGEQRHGAPLAAAFGTSPEFWMNLQSSWELVTARDAARDEDWSAMRVA